MRESVEPIKCIRYPATFASLDTRSVAMATSTSQNPFDIGKSDWLMTDSDEERTFSSTVLDDKEIVAFTEANKAANTEIASL